MGALEQVLELPVRAPDLSPVRTATTAGPVGKHPVDLLYDFLQREGGAATLAQAQTEFDRLGIGPWLTDATDFWASLNLLTERGGRLQLINTDRVTPGSPITPACWLPSTPPATS